MRFVSNHHWHHLVSLTVTQRTSHCWLLVVTLCFTNLWLLPFVTLLLLLGKWWRRSKKSTLAFERRQALKNLECPCSTREGCRPITAGKIVAIYWFASCSVKLVIVPRKYCRNRVETSSLAGWKISVANILGITSGWSRLSRRNWIGKLSPEPILQIFW